MCPLEMSQAHYAQLAQMQTSCQQKLETVTDLERQIVELREQSGAAQREVAQLKASVTAAERKLVGERKESDSLRSALGAAKEEARFTVPF